MHGVRQWWVRLSILNKAIVLSCAFVIPILLVVGLLMNDFYDYREKSDDILSEYARCTDYMNAMEQENALLGELTFAAPESDTIDKYADAVQDTAAAWERLRSAETDGSTQSEVLKQVIDRTMKSYRVRQETFIAQLHDGTFDAVNYEALRTQGSYLTQYTDQLTAAFLIGIRGVGFAGLISVFASATAIASFTMTQQMGGDAELAGDIVVSTSALCIVTMFAWSVLFKALGAF